MNLAPNHAVTPTTTQTANGITPHGRSKDTPMNHEPTKGGRATSLVRRTPLAIIAMLILSIFLAGPVSAAPQQQTMGICARTPEVQNFLLPLVTATTCDAVTNDQLAAVTSSIRIVEYSSPTLLRSDFEGLTSVTSFIIGLSPDLKTIPADAFDGFTKSSMTNVSLQSNGVETLEAGVFDGFTSLQRLLIQNTELKTLEPGVFDGLTALTKLDIEATRIRSIDEDTFEELTALTSLTISSNEITTLDEDVLDDLTALTKIEISGNDITTLPEGIFDGLTALTTIELNDNEITSLPQEIFDGHTAVQTIYLFGNQLTTLPVGIFDGLTNVSLILLEENNLDTLPVDLFDGPDDTLARLYLNDNALTTLPEGIFDGLTGLQRLRIHNNLLTTLPEDVFEAPTTLQVIQLQNNAITTLPEDVFDGLTALSALYLENNALTTLPADIFNDPVALSTLHLQGNDLTALDADLFDGLVDLYLLNLNDNSITTLPADVFDPLDESLFFLRIANNDITTLPSDVFDGLDGLQELDLSDNSITTPHADLFDPLDDSLRRLFMSNNGITTLSEDIFDGLDGLQRLDLSDNSITALHADLFDPLDDSFATLYLRSNSLTTLPSGIFDGITALNALDLSCNDMTTLTLARFAPFAATLRVFDVTGNPFINPPTDETIQATFTSYAANYIYGTGGNTDCIAHNDTGLSGLTSTDGTFNPTFEEPGLLFYSLVVSHDVSDITILPSPKDPKATVTYGTSPRDTDIDEDGFQYNMPYGHGNNRDVSIRIQSKDSYTSTTYRVNVFKEYAPSQNTRMRAVELSTVTLGETFHAETYAYTGTTDQDEITITPQLGDPDATVAFKLNGAMEADGTLQFTLAENVVEVDVTAEDGTTTQTYTFTISSTAELNTEDVANLTNLTVTPGNLIGFSPTRYSYEVGVASTVDQVTVTPTAPLEMATITYSVADSVSGTDGHQVDLSAGRNALTITVTSADGMNTETYTLSINRGVADPYGWKAVDDFDGLIASENTSPFGIWANDDTMWVADFSVGKIYAYDRGTKARDSAKDFDTLTAAGNTSPTGIWSDGTTMWVSDIDEDKIYAYDLATTVYDSTKDFDTLTAAGNTSPTGIWSDGTTMWVSDIDEDKIYAYDLATTVYDSTKDFDTLTAAGNTSPTGIWSDGDTMWVSDRGHEKLFAYNMTTHAHDTKRDFNTLKGPDNTFSNGMWSDGTTMWVADGADDKLYSYNMPPDSTDATLSALTVNPKDIIGFDGDRTDYEVGVASTVTQATITATPNDAVAAVEYSPDDADDIADGHQVALSAGRNAVTLTVTAEDASTQTYTLSINRGVDTVFGWKADDDFDGLIAAGNDEPKGIWSDGATMWVADSEEDKLYAYRMSDGQHDSSKDFNTLAAARNNLPRGIWSDGATMWVTDRNDRKIYAYRMSDTQRDSSKDFNTLATNGNHDPYSIWSDGATMWVTDRNDRKIYAYRMSDKQPYPNRTFNNLHLDNFNPTGIWSDYDTMWVADGIDNKIFAYRMSDMVRVSSKEFDTHDAVGSNDIYDIWSDGATMWVLDSVDDNKVYSYNHPASDVATLSALTVSPRDIIGFDPDDTAYDVGVASTVAQATITAAKSHFYATVAITPADVSPGAPGTPGKPRPRQERGHSHRDLPGREHYEDLHRKHQPGRHQPLRLEG